MRSLANTWKFSVGSWDTEADLQQYPLAAPSVFNFFRPGYVPPSTEMATQGATAPEFQLVSESSVSAYINYLQNIVYQGAWIGNPGEAGFPRDNLGVTRCASTASAPTPPMSSSVSMSRAPFCSSWPRPNT